MEKKDTHTQRGAVDNDVTLER